MHMQMWIKTFSMHIILQSDIYLEEKITDQVFCSLLYVVPFIVE